MNFIDKEINSGKIALFFDHNNLPIKLIVYNIGKIDIFNENIIEFKQLKITGSDLKISLMEGDEVEIKGKIKNIICKEE